MAEVMLAWTKRRSKVFHIAAGPEHRTACGCHIAPPWWSVGAVTPDGRTLCSRCVAMQRDAGKTGAA